MNNEFKKWFAARARNPDRITLEEAFAAGALSQPAPSVPDELIYVPRTLEAARDENSYLYAKGWNDCRKAMLATAPKPEGE